MTTIAYRDGCMAADTQAYLGRGEPGHARKLKVHRLVDGSLLGVSSSIVGAALRLVDWVNGGCDQQSMPVIKDGEREHEFEMLRVFEDGVVHYFNDTYHWTVIEARYFAIGSGSKYALGAMSAGCSASGAVAIACEFDQYSGGNVEQWKLVE